MKVTNEERLDKIEVCLKDLRTHSDEQDLVLRDKIDLLDDFLHNGMSNKIIKGITDYLDRQTAVRVRLFFKIMFTALAIAIAGGIVTKLLELW